MSKDATTTPTLGFSQVMDRLCQHLARDVDGAFSDAVRTLQDDLYSGLLRLTGDRHDAEDLTQETFVRAYRALKEYPPARIRKLKLRGWIWTIALNLSRNRARDRGRRPTPMELDESHSQETREPPDRAAWDRRLASLSAPQRSAVVLRHVVGLSYAEVAEALGRPQGTVKADVHRGLEKLRQIMEAER